MTPTFYALGLVGYPLSHSLSPRIHAAALLDCGLTGEYRLYPIPPSEQGEETLQNLLDQVRQGKLNGLNVTIPYKQTVLPFIDQLGSTAQAVKAVNTVFSRAGILVGENTDVAGFWTDLTKKFPDLADLGTETGEVHSHEALVLGAGGSARAVVYALCQAGWSVVIAARQVEQAQGLAATFGILYPAVQGRELSAPALLTVISDPALRLIVNATPLGMGAHFAESPWPAGLMMPEQARVYDLVYNPGETEFMRQARQAGLTAVNGLGMLLEQATLSFELWTGFRPSLEVLQEAVWDD